jgi:5-(carboxyamino)imidazole ribonucleotide synthase
MMYLAAAPLGVSVQAVDVNTETVVNPIDKRILDISLNDAITQADALTVEFEHVPEHLLEHASNSGKLHPNIDSILAGADRVREKALLQANGIANCEHEIIRTVQQLDGITERLGERIIFKASRDGYDGYGQWRLTSKSQLEALSQEFQALDLEKVPLVAEKMLAFDREISLIGARNQQGQIRCFSIAENLHHEGQLHVSVAPATQIDESLQTQANEIFTKLSEAMDYVGVLAVELFQCGETLLVNEIAPRVHNSGHWTQQGCHTSQFQQHIRAVLGLPLGGVGTCGVSAMVNIIGCDDMDNALLGLDNTHLHLYGKTVRPKRKMGHINVVADSHQNLGASLLALSEFLPMTHFPQLNEEAKRLKNS